MIENRIFIGTGVINGVCYAVLSKIMVVESIVASLSDAFTGLEWVLDWEVWEHYGTIYVALICLASTCVLVEIFSDWTMFSSCDFRVGFRVGLITRVCDTVGSQILHEDSIVFLLCDAYIEGIEGHMQWI